CCLRAERNRRGPVEQTPGPRAWRPVPSGSEASGRRHGTTERGQPSGWDGRQWSQRLHSTEEAGKPTRGKPAEGRGASGRTPAGDVLGRIHGSLKRKTGVHRDPWTAQRNSSE